MLIQIILSIIEDFIISYFIASMTNFNKKIPFIIFNTLFCSILTTIFNSYNTLSNYLPLFIFITIVIILKFFKKKITLNDIVLCLVGPILTIITDLISLLFFSIIIDTSLNILTSTSHHMVIASFFAKFLLFFSCQILIKNKLSTKEHLNYKKWGILFPICLLIFSSIYVLGNAIVNNSLSTYSMYYLIICFVLLSILIIALYNIIQKECIDIKEFELNKQKEQYIRENKNIMLRLHNEITVIDHENMYTFLQIKNLIKIKDYNSINKILDSKILSLKKYKNIIHTGNPYFDQSFNKVLYDCVLEKKDIKTICSIVNNDFSIQEKEIDFIIDILHYLLSISKSNEPFIIDMSIKSKYLVIFFIFYQVDIIDSYVIKDLEKIYSSEHIQYNYNIEDMLTYFKVIIELN